MKMRMTASLFLTSPPPPALLLLATFELVVLVLVIVVLEFFSWRILSSSSVGKLFDEEVISGWMESKHYLVNISLMFPLLLHLDFGPAVGRTVLMVGENLVEQKWKNGIRLSSF